MALAALYAFSPLTVKLGFFKMPSTGMSPLTMAGVDLIRTDTSMVGSDDEERVAGGPEARAMAKQRCDWPVIWEGVAVQPTRREDAYATGTEVDKR
ncbi:hypothetical protein PR202_gb25497 [Eleusine coracana subsp. coracana]|uniref:Uncharacterized protein n=1 Tax=Eleusine coracana subsp. coracana TaxID=191504 RepID=A0AAV5FPF0_ELECO|nr:hypothetical protein PR202_gb25497 [Eleusine coracana subsp. coracana]